MKSMKQVLVSLSKSLRGKKSRTKAASRTGSSLTHEAIRKLRRQVDFARGLDPRLGPRMDQTLSPKFQM
jgi:hypothetical protein